VNLKMICTLLLLDYARLPMKKKQRESAAYGVTLGLAKRWGRMPAQTLCLLLLAVLPAFGASVLQDGHEFTSGECYAHLNGSQLIVGNAHVRREWRIDHGHLFPISLRDLDRNVEWMGIPSSSAAPTPPVAVDTDAILLRGASGVFGPTEAESLRVELETDGSGATVDYEFQVFPAATGIRMWIVVKRSSGEKVWIAAHSTTTRQDADALEHLQITSPHIRFTQAVLRDRTDQHNELVFENEWLLSPNEAQQQLQGNVFVIENTLTGDGLVFLKEAPQPEMRPNQTPYDAWFSGSGMGVRDKQALNPETAFKFSFYGNGFLQDGVGYPFVLLSYHGGRIGRIGALQQYQRQIRQYVPGRDGLLMSNTWGDRSAGLNLNEQFLHKEIDAARSLGVDLVQIDDGWQTGRSQDFNTPPGSEQSRWKQNSHVWDVNTERFPHGLSSSTQYAEGQGIKLGLWYSPDSSGNFANWRIDADELLALNRNDGIASFKLDMVKIRSKEGEQNYSALLNRVLTQSSGRILLDLDVTADTRQGYFGDIAAGPLFVENRYTDAHRYWPHQTLRNLWKLSQYVDPLRLRMEFLNSERNDSLYPNDPLAPAHYDPGCLFAITMFGSPLGWFENTGLAPSYIRAAAPVIAQWKKEREALYRGTILPIGDAPDGITWTGFASVAAGGRGGYLLLFRELNQGSTWIAPGSTFAPAHYSIRVLSGDGSVVQTSDGFRVTIPKPLGFVWVKVEPAHGM
jgi:alpha-galactosidase